jgi:hypothetical protein
MTALTPQQVCAAIADELEAHPERWAQAGAAFTAQGFRTVPEDTQACQWCLMGMVMKSAPDITSDVYQELYFSLIAIGAGGSIANYNDSRGRTVGEIIALCRRAAGQGDGRSEPRDELQRDAGFSARVGSTL